MSLDGLIIGVDLDGVCADFYGRMREIASECAIVKKKVIHSLGKN